MVLGKEKKQMAEGRIRLIQNVKDRRRINKGIKELGARKDQIFGSNSNACIVIVRTRYAVVIVIHVHIVIVRTRYSVVILMHSIAIVRTRYSVLIIIHV